MPALYRKYRPTKLSEVIGETQVTETLENSLKAKKIAHAYLFIGPRGCGKTSVARIFAHAVNDFPYEIEDSYTDIIEIDAASNTGIDNIRELKERALIAPTKGKYKVYIIDEIHMLSKSAFNALLKLLEEPPRHVIFIMATTDAFKVPATITSRSQIYNFKLADTETMLSHLKKIAESEKINIDDAALKIITERGGGSFRDSISLLDQISSLSTGKNKITEDLVLNSLGLPKAKTMENLLSAYSSADTSAISDQLKVLLEDGVTPEIIASEIIEFILKNPNPVYLELLKTLPEVSAPFAEAKLLLALCGKVPTPASAPAQPVAVPAPVQPVATPAPTQPDPVPVSKPASTSTQPAATPAPVQAQPTSAPVSEADFSWSSYLENIQKSNFSMFDTLSKSKYSLENSTLRINPIKSVYYNILKSKRNLAVLNKHLPPNIAIELLDPNNLPPDFHPDAQESLQKDQTLSKISDIMGEDIKEVSSVGEDPF